MRRVLYLRIFLITGLLASVLFPFPVSADTLTLRPDGTGNYTGISSQTPSSGAHWDKVNEASPDTNRYVATYSDSQQKDAYTLGGTSQTGIINSVTVYFRFNRSSTPSGSFAYCQPFLRLDTSETAGTEQALNSTSWTTYNQTLARPGGGSWTWTDINNLQVCIGLRDTGTGVPIKYAQCTQVYVVVDYTPCTPPDCTITAPSSVYANSTGNTASVPDAGSSATYAWTITNGTITAGQGTRSITWRAGTISPVTIGITIDISGCQCTNSIQVAVTTPSTLAVSIGGNTSFCPGTSDNLTANAAGGVPPYSYLWSTGAPTQSIEITTPGTYSVTVTDSSICTGTIYSDTNTMVTQGNVPGIYPRNAVLAWEHPSWWPSLTGYNFGWPTDNVSQWIWETYYVVHPVDGDRVFFERNFDVPSTPTSATLHVTCDNGYEAYMNGFLLGSA